MEFTATVVPPSPGFIPQNDETISEVLSKYSPAMFRAALRKLGNREDAEDAVQDALLSASRNIGQFKGQCHISTWLVAIAINAARMHLRRQLRHRTVSLTPPSEDAGPQFVYEPADIRPDPEELYRRTEMRGIVSQFATELSPPLRKTFRLRVLEGLSIQEAAEALGVPEGTVKAQFFRARARINALIRKPQGPFRADRPKVRRRTKAHRNTDLQEPCALTDQVLCEQAVG